MFILPGQLPARLVRQAPEARRVRPGNSPQGSVVRRRTPHIPPPVAHLETGPRPNDEIQPLASLPGSQPLVSLPEINLLHICRFLQEVPQPDFTEPHSTALGGFRTSDRNSTSCNFAAFCNRLVLLESKKMRPATFWRLFLAGGAISGSKHRDLPRFGGFFWQVVPFRGPNAGTCHNFPPFSGR